MKEAKVLGACMLHPANDTAESPPGIRAGHDGENRATIFVTGDESGLLYDINHGWFGFTLDNVTAYEWYNITFTEPDIPALGAMK